MSRIEETEQTEKHISGMSKATSLALLADVDPWGPQTKTKPAGSGKTVAEVGPDAACFTIHRLDEGSKLVHDLYIAGYGHAGTYDGIHKGSCPKL